MRFLFAAGWRVFLFVCLTASGLAAESKPNIVILLADDLGWGDLKCYPKLPADVKDNLIETANLDKLAADGTRFTDAYANYMVCAPSRAGLISGRYQNQFGFFGFESTAAPFPKDIETLPEAMHRQGYVSALMGKWHVSTVPGSWPLDRGFDRFFGFLCGEHDFYQPSVGEPMHDGGRTNDAFIYDQTKPVAKIQYLTDELTDRAIDFMKTSQAGGKPFFLYLAYNAPHAPLQAPWEDLEPFLEGKGKTMPPRDIARAMVVRLDKNIGRLRDFLKKNNLEKTTLIFFASDNGGAQQSYNGGLRGQKSYFFEGGIRVPMIAAWPGVIPAGKTLSQPVILMDLYPTALAAAGATPAQFPPKLDGVDLMPLLTGKIATPPHQQLYWGDMAKHAWAVRDGKWKLVREDINPLVVRKDRVKPNMQTMLFDLEADYAESKDLFAAQPEIAAKLQKEIDAFYAASPPWTYTPEIKAAHEKELAERAKTIPQLQRQDGSPGHSRNGKPWVNY